MVMFAQRGCWLTGGRECAMIETWSLLYQLPVRRKHVVSLELATLKVRFGFERCDLSSSKARPLFDRAGTLGQRA